MSMIHSAVLTQKLGYRAVPRGSRVKRTHRLPSAHRSSKRRATSLRLLLVDRSPYRPRDEHSPTRQQTFGGRLTQEEVEKLQKPNVKRLANVTQLYFLDYYYDLLSYIHNRHNRLQAFKTHNPTP